MKNDEKEYNVNVVDRKDEDEDWDDHQTSGTLIEE